MQISQTAINIPTSGNLQLDSTNIDLPVVIATSTISSDTSVSFSGWSTVFKKIIVEFDEVVTATDSVYITLTLGESSEDTGSNYSQSLTMRGFNGSSYLFARNVGLSASNLFINTNDASASLGTGTGENFSGRLEINSVRSTTNYKLVSGMTLNYGSSPQVAYNMI